MSVMIGGVTERLAPDADFLSWDNVSNTSVVDLLSRDAERVRVAAAVTFMSGLFQVRAVGGSTPLPLGPTPPGARPTGGPPYRGPAPPGARPTPSESSHMTPSAC